MVTPVRALQKTLSVRLYSMSRLSAARFPDEVLDLLFAVGSQVFSEHAQWKLAKPHQR
jgi:hypothetical protein